MKLENKFDIKSNLSEYVDEEYSIYDVEMLPNGDYIVFDYKGNEGGERAPTSHISHRMYSGNYKVIWGGLAKELWSLAKSGKITSTATDKALRLVVDFPMYLHGMASSGMFFNNIKFIFAETHPLPYSFICAFSNQPMKKKAYVTAVFAITVWAWSLMRDPDEEAIRLLGEGIRYYVGGKKGKEVKVLKEIWEHVKNGGSLFDYLPPNWEECVKKYGYKADIVKRMIMHAENILRKIEKMPNFEDLF